MGFGQGENDNIAGKQAAENSKKAAATGCRFLLVAMFLRDAAGTTLYGQPKFDDGATPVDRDKEIREVMTAFEAFRKEMPPEVGLGIDVH